MDWLDDVDRDKGKVDEVDKVDKDMLDKDQVYNLDMDNVEKDKVENIFLFFSTADSDALVQHPQNLKHKRHCYIEPCAHYMGMQ